MHDEKAVELTLRAGGIVPEGAKVKKGEKVGAVSARKFVHPALKGRTVVRLTTAEMAPGVDVEMETLGFSPPTATPRLGWQRYRALGFPGWALVHDPARAKFALDVMKELKKAAARVKSKPGHARDAFLVIGEKLGRTVPHFLPSFWEEVGRAFLAEDASSFAAQSFEKARTTEKEHGLKVDEDLRAEVFLEFALAGAVNAKSLATYGKDLEKGFGPKEGYARFFELARRRTLGGMPPWTGMAKDLRAFAKLAKADTNAEDERFVLETIDARALALAPAELWTAYGDALVRLAIAKPEVRDRLRRLFPKPPRADKTFFASWLALLDKAGALAAVTDEKGDEAAREAHGMAADWLEKALAWAPHQPELAAIVDRMAKRLVAEAAPVQIAQGTRWWATLSLDVTETVLARGVPIQPIVVNSHFDLGQPFVLDPVHVAADPRFSQALANAVGQQMGRAAFEEAAKGKSGLVSARRAWVEARIGEASKGPIPSLSDALKQIQSKTSALTFAEFPEAKAAFLALSPKHNVAVHLRGGHFAELAWPAFEKAHAALGKATLGGYFPYPILYSATKAIVIGASGFLLEHDLKVPAGGRLSELLFVPTNAAGLEGQLLVVFWDAKAAKNMAYWSATPNETFEWVDSGYYGAGPLRVPGGPGLVFSGRAFVVGDTRVQREGATGLVSDGKKVWVVESDATAGVALRELDPATGQKGNRSWPEIMGDPSALRIIQCTIQPLPPGADHSLFGSKDGLVGGWATQDQARSITRYFGVDGRTYERDGGGHYTEVPLGLFSFPGDPAPRVVTDRSYYSSVTVTLHDAERSSLGAIGNDPWSLAGWPAAPPGRHWHFLRARDEKASLALRSATDDDAEALLATATLPVDAADTSFGELGKAIKKTFPAVMSPELLAGIAALARYGAAAAASHAAIVKSHAEASPLATKGLVDDTEARIAIGSFVPTTYSTGQFSSALEASSKYLAGENVAELPGTSVQWELLLGHIRGIVVRLMGPGIEAGVRKSTASILERWKDTIFATDLEKLRLATATMTDASPFMRLVGGRPASSWLHTIGASRYFVRITNLGDLSAGTPRSFNFVEYSTDGAFRDPPGTTLVTEARFPASDDAAYITNALALYAEKQAPAWDKTIAEEVGTKTGLTRSEAIVLVAGFPNVDGYVTDFLGKDLRTTVDLKSGDAKAARETFRGLTQDKALRLLAGMAPTRAEGFYSPHDGGDESFASRIAASWIAVGGQRVTVREDLVLLCDKELTLDLPAAAALGALLEPEKAPCLVARPKYDMALAFAYGKVKADDPFGHRVAGAFATLIPFLFHALPVGDAYRDAIPTLYAKVRERTLDPELIAPLRNDWGEPKSFDAFFETLGGEDVAAPNLQKVRDTGAVRAELQISTLRVGFRPGKVTSFADDTSLQKLGEGAHGALPAIAFLLENLPAFVDRIRTTPVPAGGYEANPALSAKATVDAAKKELGVSFEAATLYLQLLALAEPTSKSVIVWNGWKPADYKKAAQELLTAKLVLEGKREKAGREIFLPGAWEKKAGGDVPLEAWKLPLFVPRYGRFAGLTAPLPHHAMFEAAFARIVKGDTPKFEEV